MIPRNLPQELYAYTPGRLRAIEQHYLLAAQRLRNLGHLTLVADKENLAFRVRQLIAHKEGLLA